MRPKPRTEVHRADGYEVHVVGIPPPGFRDLYLTLLRTSWPRALAAVVLGYLALNALFALLYVAAGGIAHARPGDLSDAFFFSVQTMGTIGYGAMYPETPLTNVLVVLESVTGLIVTALATGLVFARFSLTRARVVFSREAAISPMDGVPTLMIRLGNERRGAIVDASFRLTLTRTMVTAEGVTMYRTEELELVRARATALSRSWSVLHAVAGASPLVGQTPESLAAAEAELTLSVVGTDETSLQPVHAQHVWMARRIVWGARLADVISEEADRMIIDLHKFHDLTPTLPTPSFPYPRTVAQPAAQALARQGGEGRVEP